MTLLPLHKYKHGPSEVRGALLRSDFSFGESRSVDLDSERKVTGRHRCLWPALPRGAGVRHIPEGRHAEILVGVQRGTLLTLLWQRTPPWRKELVCQGLGNGLTLKDPWS